jgi:hypothetical protein
MDWSRPALSLPHPPTSHAPASHRRERTGAVVHLLFLLPHPLPADHCLPTHDLHLHHSYNNDHLPSTRCPVADAICISHVLPVSAWPDPGVEWSVPSSLQTAALPHLSPANIPTSTMTTATHTPAGYTHPLSATSGLSPSHPTVSPPSPAHPTYHTISSPPSATLHSTRLPHPTLPLSSPSASHLPSHSHPQSQNQNQYQYGSPTTPSFASHTSSPLPAAQHSPTFAAHPHPTQTAAAARTPLPPDTAPQLPDTSTPRQHPSLLPSAFQSRSHRSGSDPDPSPHFPTRLFPLPTSTTTTMNPPQTQSSQLAQRDSHPEPTKPAPSRALPPIFDTFSSPRTSLTSLTATTPTPLAPNSSLSPSSPPTSYYHLFLASRLNLLGHLHIAAKHKSVTPAAPDSLLRQAKRDAYLSLHSSSLPHLASREDQARLARIRKLALLLPPNIATSLPPPSASSDTLRTASAQLATLARGVTSASQRIALTRIATLLAERSALLDLSSPGHTQPGSCHFDFLFSRLPPSSPDVTVSLAAFHRLRRRSLPPPRSTPTLPEDHTDLLSTQYFEDAAHFHSPDTKALLAAIIHFKKKLPIAHPAKLAKGRPTLTQSTRSSMPRGGMRSPCTSSAVSSRSSRRRQEDSQGVQCSASQRSTKQVSLTVGMHSCPPSWPTLQSTTHPPALPPPTQPVTGQS